MPFIFGGCTESYFPFVVKRNKQDVNRFVHITKGKICSTIALDVVRWSY